MQTFPLTSNGALRPKRAKYGLSELLRGFLHGPLQDKE